ncbi:hypothetical protein BCR44DRAFT_154888 [Catenaria anguillulae PL171]|uniref:PIPK domain-containing protein n=1 Tax=Catenaria anguillulae PL171 TaxID=765915 RepID=A0A1Y2HB59_9FUNG|nr:hypothetical protein BCR44DRAFT_154888 [Catenaria anguillulae PL171]
MVNDSALGLSVSSTTCTSSLTVHTSSHMAAVVTTTATSVTATTSTAAAAAPVAVASHKPAPLPAPTASTQPVQSLSHRQHRRASHSLSVVTGNTGTWPRSGPNPSINHADPAATSPTTSNNNNNPRRIFTNPRRSQSYDFGSPVFRSGRLSSSFSSSSSYFASPDMHHAQLTHPTTTTTATTTNAGAVPTYRRASTTPTFTHAYRASHSGAMSNTTVSLQRRAANRLRYLSTALGTHTIGDPRQDMYAFVSRLLAGLRCSVLSLSEVDDSAAPSLTRLVHSDYTARTYLSSTALTSAAALASSSSPSTLIRPTLARPSLRDGGIGFKDYAPQVFHQIRTHFHVSTASYLDSLTSECVLAAVRSPGKSASTLFYSRDYRYIIKTIRRDEMRALLRILPTYARHIASQPDTLLARYYGLHRIVHERKKVWVIVMANVFPPTLDVHYKFDLKGSTKGRRSLPKDPGARLGVSPHVVLKDLDWLALGRRMVLDETRRRKFKEQIIADTRFLVACGLMDYSLLVGVHELGRGNDLATTMTAAASASSTVGPVASEEGVEGCAAGRGQHSATASGLGVPMGTGMGGGVGTLEILTPPPSPNPFGDHRHHYQSEIDHGAMTLPTHPHPPTLARPAARGPIFRVNTVSELHLPENAPQAASSLFFCDHGGMCSSYPPPARYPEHQEIYFVSVIDILTPYNWVKRMESAVKVGFSKRRKLEVSAINPKAYGERFVRFMVDKVVA